ncbi:MAG: Dabb family protein [Lacisediminihabitans sp.]
MIKHMVSWKLASDDADVRLEQAEKVVAGLRAFVGVVPSIRALHAGVGLGQGSTHWDIGLIVDFDDEAGLEEYQVNPDHKAFGKYIRSVISEQATVDFEF